MSPLAAGKVFSGRLGALLIMAALAAPPLCHAAQKQDDVGEKWAKRDAWQHPSEVMDALGLKAGSVVGDVGCGEGYFTFHFASRVGPQGKVYAEDIDYKVLNKISDRAFKEKLGQIEEILGSDRDPRLPATGLDAILVVDAFHEMHNYDDMLQGMYLALKPGGLLGIIDRKAEPGQPRSNYFEHHRIPEKLTQEDATRNGFRLLRKEAGFTTPERNYFFLLFQKPNTHSK